MANVSSSNGLEKRPKLRFPGFDEPWEICKAESLFRNITDKNHPDDTVLTIVQGKGTLPRDKSGRNIHYDDASLSNYKRVEKGDFIIHLRSFEGGLEMAHETGIVSPAYTILRCSKPHSSLFYEAYFHTDEFINHALSKAVEGIRDGRQISYEAFKWLGIPYCTNAEQEKISGLFDAINRRIEKQEQIVNALKKYKRGLQNRFFFKRSQLSQKTSEIGSHEVKPLGSIVQINPKTGSLPEAYIYIDLECVEGGVLNSKKLISRNSAPSRAQRLLEKGDLIYQMVRPYQKNNYYFQKAFEYPTVASTGYAQIRCSEMDTQFIYEQLSSDYFAHEAMLRSTGTGYPAINADDLAEIPIWVPPFERQQKVGAVLSFIGAKIEANQRMLSALCRVKSSLLQQLFI